MPRGAGFPRRKILLLRRLPLYLLAQPLLLLAQLGRELGAEVRRLEQRAHLDLAVLVMRVGAAREPFERLVHRLDLPQPEAGDQLLRLGEGAVDDGALLA